MDKISKERFLYGNFEYDDDPAKMIEYDKIIELFDGKEIEKLNEKYMSVDPARFGQDRTVIMVWQGLYVKKVYVYPITSTTFNEEKIKKIATEENIPWEKIIVDEDGVGGGIVDHLLGVKGFVNNSVPIITRTDINNYRNLKSQCYNNLSININSGKIKVNIENLGYKESLIEELEQVKRKDVDKDGKFQVISKEEVKENIGRSPDFADCMMMRMYFELNSGEMTFLSDPENLMGLE